MKKVRKAVIAAAGMGTRFLPQTKAMPKEMLPILDKPVIQIVVEGLVDAGVEDIIIVTGPTKRAIEDHFDRSIELEESLNKKGKETIAAKLADIANLANFIYVRQKGEPAGNARPVLNASHLLGNEPFFFFFADDFFIGEKSTATQLLEAYQKVEAPIVALRDVPKNEVSTYGIADITDESGSLCRVKGIIEKPEINEAPSTKAVASGYLLTPDIMPIIAQEKIGPDGEIRISDSFEELAKARDAYGLTIEGSYHDTGNPLAYLKTVLSIAINNAEYGEELHQFINSSLKR
jgi:UTP--glucose-1-phosphate uridylyltransferase